MVSREISVWSKAAVRKAAARGRTAEHNNIRKTGSLSSSCASSERDGLAWRGGDVGMTRKELNYVHNDGVSPSGLIKHQTHHAAHVSNTTSSSAFHTRGWTRSSSSLRSTAVRRATTSSSHQSYHATAAVPAVARLPPPRKGDHQQLLLSAREPEVPRPGSHASCLVLASRSAPRRACADRACRSPGPRW